MTLHAGDGGGDSRIYDYLLALRQSYKMTANIAGRLFYMVFCI